MNNQKDNTDQSKSQATPLRTAAVNGYHAPAPVAPVAPAEPGAGGPVTVDEWEEFARQEYEENRQFKRLRLSDLRARPPMQWLIQVLVCKGDIAMIYGPSGTGKTFVVFDLIMASITGQTFADTLAIPRPMTVAYCAGEGQAGLNERFAAANVKWDIDPAAENRLSIYENVIQLKPPQLQQSMAAFIDEWKHDNGDEPLDLLIIDTLATATEGADENSARDMGLVIGQCKVAARELGCAVLLVHHSNKAGTSERGSGVIKGASSGVIELTEQFVIQCRKVKDGKNWGSKGFMLITTGNDFPYVDWKEKTPAGQRGDATREAVEDITNVLADDGGQLTATTISSRIGKKANWTIKLLKQMAADNLVTATIPNTDRPAGKGNATLYSLVNNNGE